MARRSYALAGIVTAFVFILLYATFRFTPAPLPLSPEDRLAATRECQRAIGEEIADARFPFEATAQDLGSGGLQLSGSVDSGSRSQSVRRNFDCYLHVNPSTGGYVADSTLVWQSH